MEDVNRRKAKQSACTYEMTEGRKKRARNLTFMHQIFTYLLFLCFTVVFLPSLICFLPFCLTFFHQQPVGISGCSGILPGFLWLWESPSFQTSKSICCHGTSLLSLGSLVKTQASHCFLSQSLGFIPISTDFCRQTNAENWKRNVNFTKRFEEILVHKRCC